MKITINGQLTLMMLYEMIMTNIPGATALMQNTDGIETKIPRKYLDKYMEICSEWEKITNLSLEHDQYQKLIIADVNNYIGLNNFKQVDITTWRKVKKENPHYLFKVEGDKFMYAPAKLKGRFDFFELALHKNKSKLVIPKAIYYYFIHDILPNDYLKQNRNILDYCIGGKSKGNWKQVARYIKNGDYFEDDLQKINRYYITKLNGRDAVKIIKINTVDCREIQLEAGHWMQKIFNKISINPQWDSYNIDERYYIQAIESEINNITNNSSNQLNLFNYGLF
jgi:hypothetical protein